MQSKLAISSAAILLLLVSLAQAQSNDGASCFTLQVASFPDAALAEGFAAKLARAGEQPGWGTVELPGRGHWTRVFIGSFKTMGAARQHGDALVGRGIIAEYIVKTAYDVKSLSRPRTVGSRDIKASDDTRPNVSLAINAERTLLPGNLRIYGAATLPVAAKVKLSLAPSVDTASIPRPDPVRLAFDFIVGASAQRGGLWLSGDKKEAMERLRWIVGNENADLISFDETGRVKLSKRLLAQAAKANEASSLEAPLFVADYISSNEGLLLLVQLTQGPHR
jgi:SPOR domain